MTMAGKSTMNESMYFLLKMGIFQCHVSFQGCTTWKFWCFLMDVLDVLELFDGYPGNLVFFDGYLLVCVCVSPFKSSSK